MTLLVVALAAGGCSAGFDRMDLAPMNYNGGPSSTGTAPPIPREPMRQSQAPLGPQGGEYRSDYRPEPREDYRPAYRAGARNGERITQPQGGDSSVRVAGLPEPYDRAPVQHTTPPPAPRAPVASYDAGRTPSRSIPPQASYTPPGRSAQPQGNTIEVRPGDTLYALSKTHRVPMSELMRANNLTSAQLRIGQQLVLPSRPRRVASLPTAPEASYVPPPAYVPPAAYVPPTPAPPRSAVPARAPEPILPHHTDAGPIVPPLPETTPSTPASVASAPAAEAGPVAPSSRADDSGWTGTYTVQRGDSLYGIARKHGVKPHVLERVNQIDNPRKVMPGTVLKVPTSADKAQAARAARMPAQIPATKSTLAGTRTPVAAPAPQDTSGAPSVQPTIINARGPAPTEEHKRVASLGQGGVTDASPPGAPEPAPRATDAPHREASVPAAKAATPPGKFRWPARGKIIAGFGNQPGVGPNDGINISVPHGTEVHAAENGTVTYAGNEVQGYGNLVLIRHPEGWITAYAHNDKLMVKSGENVRRGQIIAKAGNTGSVSQPQLHFEIRQGATPVDPMQHLER